MHIKLFSERPSTRLCACMLVTGAVVHNRGGEESRVHLIGCAESYLAHHPHDGYDPTAPPEELHALRGSFRSRAALLPKADRVCL